MNETQPAKELIPLKLFLHGPPASGKTQLAKKLCQKYGAHYVSVKTMIEETLDDLRRNIEQEKNRTKGKKTVKQSEEDLDEEQTEESEEEEDEPFGDIEYWQEQVRDIQSLMAKNENKRLPDDYVVKMMRDFLSNDICQIRGYVLDGYPKTIEQAKELFGQAAEGIHQLEEIVVSTNDGEGDVIGDVTGNASLRIMPDFVVSLEGDDDMLCERVMNMPQREIQGTHFEEASMLRRLAEFRQKNGVNNTVLIFFDEAKVHPILIDLVDIETQLPIPLEDIYNNVCSILGPPVPGFGISAEEEEELRALEQQQRRLQEEGDRLERKLLEEQATAEYQAKMERWAETFEKLQQQEEKLLAAQSEPLRSYLMKYIFPTLSKGLVEVAKLKPDDPIDFLAEYLFKENPEGKMFDPSYTREGEELFSEYEKHVGGFDVSNMK